MNKFLKYIIALYFILYYGCDIINPPAEEEKESEGIFYNHKNFRIIPDTALTDVIDDSTYSLKVNIAGDAKLKLRAEYKYDYSGYYQWRTASETGFVTLKSEKIYFSNENTLSVYLVENNSFILVVAGIDKNKSIYISHIYLKVERS